MRMKARYQNLQTTLEEGSRRIRVRFHLDTDVAGPLLGWQIYDPVSATFILEGEWKPVENRDVDLAIELPRESGPYRVYVSPIDDRAGWFYAQGSGFVVVDAQVDDGSVVLAAARVTTLGRLRRQGLMRSLPKLFTLPSQSLWRNRRLIRSMVRRDIMARYRGSFGDALWTVLNPLLLMATYFFVFGVVLDTRFGPDASRTGFALYFLAGMLPWLAFAEAVGRAPHVIFEYRNFVKKLVFPLDTLPVNHVIAGLVSEAFAAAVFLVILLAMRHGLPLTVLWLPVLVIPQLLFTLGLSWFLAGLGAFVRDLTQVIGFLLTLWFFITPICYPEDKLPQVLAPYLAKNPIFVLVRGYRAILLEHHAPDFGPMWKLWLLSLVVAVLGYAWFHKLRKSFADVI